MNTLPFMDMIANNWQWIAMNGNWSNYWQVIANSWPLNCHLIIINTKYRLSHGCQWPLILKQIPPDQKLQAHTDHDVRAHWAWTWSEPEPEPFAKDSPPFKYDHSWPTSDFATDPACERAKMGWRHWQVLAKQRWHSRWHNSMLSGIGCQFHDVDQPWAHIQLEPPLGVHN